ncbi:cytochrome c oxidase subunit II [Undibacterium sp. TJN25]|uniref:cytochrome c oxidase subunit II n=1 Tax=Undibacterium sp. TJN25 TaxID=3413056 RepID=UPI003BF05052
MAMVIALVVIVVASLLFHLVSPWWLTPLASNWGRMDHTLMITLVITGFFFVVINVFLAYSILKFRHRAGNAAPMDRHSGHRAGYQPENKKLEKWLIIATSIGIIGLLAPGLFVYADYVKAPHDAQVLEIVGQQWQWRFRFPGPSGKLGLTNVALINGGNPFGIDPKDPAGQDNVIINSGEVHLPLGKPIKVLLRSNDVLHDFFVPPFRARMNIVPGMVTTFWFTPTKAGRYEAMCAQLCGVGHANMRGYVVVEDEATFKAWLKAQPTFAASLTPATPSAPSTTSSPAAAGTAAAPDLAAQGKALSQSKGCVACHSVDGSAGVGPTWKGLYGKTETMADGSTALVDEAYLKSFIREPAARTVKGFAPIMPKIEMSDAELDALVAYIQTYGSPLNKKQ